MSKHLLKKIGSFLLALTLVLPIALTAGESIASAAGDTVDITLHKLQFDENPETHPNPGTEITDPTAIWPGATPLAGAEFTVYDVTDAYHTAYKNAYEGNSPGDGTTAGNAERSVAAAVQFVQGTQAGTVPSYSGLTPSAAEPIEITSKTTDANGLATFTGLPKEAADDRPAVYLFVETGTGSDPIVTKLSDNMIVALPVYDAEDNELEEIHLYPKNTTSTSDIEITKDTVKYDHKIGEDIEYTIKATIPDNIEAVNASTGEHAYTKFEIRDIHDPQLTFNKAGGYSLIVKGADGETRTTLQETLHYTVTEEEDNGSGRKTFAVKLTEAGLRELKNDDLSLIFTYKMYLNETAEADTDYLNKATVETDYDEDESEDVKVITGGYEFVKKDGASGNELKGAEFYVRDGSGNNAAYLKAVFSVEDETLVEKLIWVSSAEEATTFVSGEDGRIKLRGLDNGTYYMQEITAPEGYILPDNPYTEFTVVCGVDGAGTCTVKKDDPDVINNAKKGMLPSTGGMGIYLFLAIGFGAMGLGALWYVRSKRQVS